MRRLAQAENSRQLGGWEEETNQTKEKCGRNDQVKLGVDSTDAKYIFEEENLDRPNPQERFNSGLFKINMVDS